MRWWRCSSRVGKVAAAATATAAGRASSTSTASSSPAPPVACTDSARVGDVVVADAPAAARPGCLADLPALRGAAIRHRPVSHADPRVSAGAGRGRGAPCSASAARRARAVPTTVGLDPDLAVLRHRVARRAPRPAGERRPLRLQRRRKRRPAPAPARGPRRRDGRRRARPGLLRPGHRLRRRANDLRSRRRQRRTSTSRRFVEVGREPLFAGDRSTLAARSGPGHRTDEGGDSASIDCPLDPCSERDADRKASQARAIDSDLATGAADATEEPAGIPGRPERPPLVGPHAGQAAT